MSSDARPRKEGSPLRNDIPLPARWMARAFQKYWRVVRGLRLSVEACVIDAAGRPLMVRNENGGTWELPAGIVQNSEDLEMALRRVLREMAGIEVNGKPELSFFHADARNAQTGLYLVRDWRQPAAPVSPEARFFPLSALPQDINPEVAERIRRSVEDRTASEV